MEEYTEISHREPEDGNKTEACVSNKYGSLDVFVKGYGYDNPVVSVEVCAGVARVLIYGDIGSDEPTEVISLKGAKE